MSCGHGRFLLLFLAKDLFDQHIKEWCKNNYQNVAVTIPPSTPVPMAFCAPAPAPVVRARGRTPKPKASEVITDWTESQFRSFQRGFDESHSFFHSSFGELDDQDGVFGGQTQRG